MFIALTHKKTPAREHIGPLYLETDAILSLQRCRSFGDPENEFTIVTMAGGVTHWVEEQPEVVWRAMHAQSQEE